MVVVHSINAWPFFRWHCWKRRLPKPKNLGMQRQMDDDDHVLALGPGLAFNGIGAIKNDFILF